MCTKMKNNLLGKKFLSCSFYLYRFRKYVSYGFPIINFCNPGVHYETPCIMGTADVHAEVQIWGETSASWPGRSSPEIHSLLPWVDPRIDVDTLQKTKTSCSCLAFIWYPLFTVGAADYLLFNEFRGLRHSKRHTPSHTIATNYTNHTACNAE